MCAHIAQHDGMLSMLCGDTDGDASELGLIMQRGGNGYVYACPRKSHCAVWLLEALPGSPIRPEVQTRGLPERTCV